MERGLGASASLETWCAVSAAVGEQLAAFLEHAPEADHPRDYQHLLRQRLVIETAVGGGWRALPEEPIDDRSERSRAVDVLLLRAQKREAAAAECVDFLDDVGAAMRGLDAKVAALERRLTLGRDVTEAGWRVSGVLVVRRTRRNRQLVLEFASVFVAKFAASPIAWLAALTDPSRPMPNALGFLWTDVTATRLIAARLSPTRPTA